MWEIYEASNMSADIFDLLLHGSSNTNIQKVHGRKHSSTQALNFTQGNCSKITSIRRMFFFLHNID